MAYTEDQGVWPHLVALRDCLRDAIEKRGLPMPCLLEVFPGSFTPFDTPEEGQAWVRLAQAFPTVQFPNQTQDWRSSCGTNLAYVIEVGIIRCAPQMSEGGDMPTAEEEFEATRLQMADMAAMRLAIQCCFARRPALLGAYTPLGPEGLALGGTWSVTI